MSSRDEISLGFLIHHQGPTGAHLVTTKPSVEKRGLGGEASMCLSLMEISGRRRV